MTHTFVLSHNPKIRYATGAMMYFAQGIPFGLLSIALPAWLASQGISASDIGSYLAVIILPWAFKLVTGPFMDRFQFPAMGRRRPWIIGAQFGLTVSLLALMLIKNPAEQMGLLMVIGILINSFTATQDVAVDGMAIDVTPVREQGRLNAFMTFGKAVGWGLTSAVAGVMLVTYGLQATALVASAVAGVVLVLFIFVLERPGERRLPWSAGEARGKKGSAGTFKAVFKGINKVLWTRTSLIVMLIMLFDGLVAGYGQALMPVAAVNVFGYTTPQWSQLVAMMGLTGAVVTLAMGPFIDKFGAKRMLFLTVTLVSVHAFLLAQTQFLWTDTLYVRVMLSIWVMMMPITMVSVIALGMAVCKTKCSATQFAIYMSIANLGHSGGSKLFGMVSDRAGFVEIYLLMSTLAVTLIFVLFFYRQPQEGGKGKKARVKTVVGGGNHAGVFWTGAMRCPKCRSDMDLVEYEGVEIDRCHSCHGIWFDAGEMELLSNPDAALAIDDGSASVGHKYNVIEDYCCPRCGGTMDRRADEHQPHIWYETCTECNGSFFDAGEFRDLAQHTVSDYFKRLVTPRRS